MKKGAYRKGRDPEDARNAENFIACVLDVRRRTPVAEVLLLVVLLVE